MKPNNRKKRYYFTDHLDNLEHKPRHTYKCVYGRLNEEEYEHVLYLFHMYKEYKDVFNKALTLQELCTYFSSVYKIHSLNYHRILNMCHYLQTIRNQRINDLIKNNRIIQEKEKINNEIINQNISCKIE